jgi:hypothetical protein
MSPNSSSYEQLDRVLRGSEGEEIRDYDREIALRRPSSVAIVLTSRSSRMTDVGRIIARTDRELRRSATILRSNRYYVGTEWDRPTPISPNSGGLTLIDAVPGSIHVLLEAYGKIQSLLVSKPLQALTTLLALEQGFSNIRFWSPRKKDPLAGISARQALEVLKAYGGDTGRLMREDSPNLVIEIDKAKEEREVFRHPELPENVAVTGAPSPLAEVRVSRSGEVIIRGQRLTCILEHPDGSQSIIFLDGY